VRTQPSFSAARTNSFALAGTGDGEFDVAGELLAAFSEPLGNHVKDVLEFALRLTRQ
jgi:hypothetical protein